MNIVKNLGPFIKILASLREPRKLKKPLDEAREKGDKKEERRLLHELEKNWGNAVVEKFGGSIVVTGAENFPKEGPVVFVSNHQGFADIPVLCAAIDHLSFGFVARENLRKVPFIGPWMERIRCVFLKREDPRAALNSIKEGVDLIEEGYSLLIFPEGTRSHGGPMGPFKPGALKLATKPKVPIVPISINGTAEMYEKTGRFRGSDTSVLVHPPIDTSSLSKEELKTLPDKVHEIIRIGLEHISSMDGDDIMRGEKDG